MDWDLDWQHHLLVSQYQKLEVCLFPRAVPELYNNNPRSDVSDLTPGLENIKIIVVVFSRRIWSLLLLLLLFILWTDHCRRGRLTPPGRCPAPSGDNLSWAQIWRERFLSWGWSWDIFISRHRSFTALQIITIIIQPGRGRGLSNHRVSLAPI